MTDTEVRESLGYATLEPGGEIVAGSYVALRLTYAVGSKGVGEGGRIRLYTDSDTDWGIPQFDDPSAAEYMTVEAPEGARIGVMAQDVKTLLLVVSGRGLRPGEKLVVRYGDRSEGGPGSRAQTFQERHRYFWVAVDSQGNGEFVALPDPPYVTVVGGQAAGLFADAPSTVAVGKPFRLLVRAEDEWGNPASLYRGTIELRGAGIEIPERRLTFGPDDGGVRWVEGCRASGAGLHRIAVSDPAAGLAARSNPILCCDPAETHNLYWGDPHGGQVALNEKIEDFFRFARDVAGLDFAGYQRNDHMLSNEDWAAQQRAERRFHEPGRFIPLPGFEWSALPENGGHHNVYFRRHSQPIRRNSHLSVEDKSDEDTDLPHILDVFAAYRGGDVVLTPHVGGARADLTYHEPTLEPALEVTSTHGTFEWFLRESLGRRYRLGFVGGSDSHTGRPGTDRPGHQERRYAKAGLTGLYASEASLESFHDALKARRCYGTTSARIIAKVDVDGHAMGTEFSTSAPPEISAFVAGTAPLESLELFRGLDRIYSHPLGWPSASRRVRVLWEGASRKTSYSGVIWDGTLSVHRGKLTSVEKVRFDSPRCRVFEVTAGALRWHSETCGYRSGIILDLDGDDDLELRVVVNTSLASRVRFGGHGDGNPTMLSYSPGERLAFEFSVKGLAEGPVRHDIGMLDRAVTVSLAPEPGGPEHAEFIFTDPSPQPGINPYWVRAVQTDMEMAWTSPVFVDFVAPPP